MTQITTRTILMVVLMTFCSLGNAHAVSLPSAHQDESLGQSALQKKIVLAGGCFWGVEAVFRHVRGVTRSISGYAGGTAEHANYNDVSNGQTSHAEAVEITYDSSQITLGTILKIFFSVAHDPTQKNGQGPDHGSQYRSAVFVEKPEQEDIVKSYITQINQSGVFDKEIETMIEPLEKFYPAELYHQNYVETHPQSPYVVIHDAPKLRALKDTFPDLYVK